MLHAMDHNSVILHPKINHLQKTTISMRKQDVYDLYHQFEMMGEIRTAIFGKRCMLTTLINPKADYKANGRHVPQQVREQIKKIETAIRDYKKQHKLAHSGLNKLMGSRLKPGTQFILAKHGHL